MEAADPPEPHLGDADGARCRGHRQPAMQWRDRAELAEAVGA